MLEAYALITHERHGTELAALLHRGEHVARAQQQLNDFIRDLLTDGAENGDLREDVAPEELASYCLHALAAASSLPSKASVRRLVRVTVARVAPGVASSLRFAPISDAAWDIPYHSHFRSPSLKERQWCPKAHALFGSCLY